MSTVLLFTNCGMNDYEEVVFQGSSLHEHLKSSGFDSEEICPQSVLRFSNDKDLNLEATHLEAELTARRCADYENDSDHSENINAEEDLACRKRYKFSLKLFLFGVTRWLFGINAWQMERKQNLEQFALNINEDIFNASVLEEDDSEFVDKFSRAMRDRFVESENDNLGEYFKHGAIFVVVLGYGIGRAIQINRTGVAGMNTWAMDVAVVGLMVCVLLPSVVKIIAVEKFSQKLKASRKKILIHLTEMARCFVMFKKAVRLIQEMELINRGFSLAEVRSSVTAGDENKGGKLSERQCPALRESVFRLARDVMLSTKTAANKLLDIYPLQDKLEGGPSYLCLLDLAQYGPCVLAESGSEELYKTTDAYALGAIKGMVALCQSHASEWLRIVSVYCLLHSQEDPKDFEQLFPVMDNLHKDVTKHVTHLEYIFLLHKSRLVTESEEKDRTKKEGVYKDVSVAVNSLSLHIKAAFYRLQKLEDKLEEVATPGAESIPPDVMKELSTHLDIVRCDLDASQECWTESMKRIKGEKKTCTEVHVNPEVSTKTPEGRLKTDEPVLISGEPQLVEDQVFEAYTDPNEPLDSSETSTFLSEEEKVKRQKEKQEAVRMLKELKSVITLRAEDTRQREARALTRMKNNSGQSETLHHDTKPCDTGESETISNEAEEINIIQNQSETERRDITLLENDTRQYTSGSKTSSHYDDRICSRGETNSVSNRYIPNQRSNISISGFEQSDDSQESQQETCTYETNESITTGLVFNTADIDERSETSQDFIADGIDINEEGDKGQCIDNKSNDETLSLKEKLEKIHGGGFSFTSNIASLAASKSQQMAALAVDTFGDDSD